MSHKAGKEFFKYKREWSKRKDRILGSYLTAYLLKIATQKKPVLIVDGFAGPGVFRDGDPGSPLIVCQVIEAAVNKLSVDVSAIFIEPDDELNLMLERTVRQYQFASVRKGLFSDFIDEIEKGAIDHNVFLYIDPFTVEGLVWDEIDRICRHLNVQGISVELLMNFNAASFVRRGLAALQRTVPEIDESLEDTEQDRFELVDPPDLAKLNRVVGGEWWQDMLLEEAEFSLKVDNVSENLCLKLKNRFSEVCMHAMVAKPSHTIPKYYLIFASRHPHALRLMNDEMLRSHQVLAEMAKPKYPTLFEMRSETLVPNLDRLPDSICAQLPMPKKRGDLIIDVIRTEFGIYVSKDIRKAIENMLKSGVLKSQTG
ncbi:MAG: three-Cys-motif partner protein TcmP, partial [Planctomycetes bacterium]|nr:three-Cys-motif partner protein TcmP [Planctomycetota bacterium]